MNTLVQKRCFNHSGREAVARCPECQRFFCRECVTEHDSRVVCAQCLKKLTGGGQQRTARFAVVALAAKSLAGFLFLWLFFYGLGRTLISIPADFHEGTLWKDGAARIED